MAAAARVLSPPRPTPRLVPRPTPKSVPPPLPNATARVDKGIVELSDTAVHEFTPEDVERVAPQAPVVATSAALGHAGKPQHPGLALLRTIGFFVAELAVDGVRALRARFVARFVTRWVRASARARA